MAHAHTAGGFTRRMKPKKRKADSVRAPRHYLFRGMEMQDILRAFLTKEEYRGHLKATAVQYIIRADRKGGDEDLAKAIQTLKFAQRKR